MTTDVLGAQNYSEMPTVNGVPISDMTAQVVRAIYSGTTAATTGTTIIPTDTSIPLSTEGTQIWTQTVTPASVSSKFGITQSFLIDSNTSNRNIVVALFRGTTCIYATCTNIATSGRPVTIAVTTLDAPATTSATTYSLRVGVSSSAKWSINQNNVAAITFGGTANQSDWLITEFA